MQYGALLLCVAAIPCAGQQPGSATALGQCNQANTGNNNTFNITCGIAKQQGDKMIKILNKILTEQLDPDAVMKKLDEILHAVNPNGTKVTYLANGGTRSVWPGGIDLNDQPLPEFAPMMEFNSSHQWQKLAELCERSIVDHPGWLTPVALAGIAYLNLGQKDKGIDLLTQADEGMAGNRDYGTLPADVKRILSVLGIK